MIVMHETTNKKTIKEEILKITANDEYMKDRGRVRNLYHTFQDGNSSDRIWKEIKSEI